MGIVVGAAVARAAIGLSGADRSGSVAWYVVTAALAGGLLGLTGARIPQQKSTDQETRAAHSRHIRFEDFLPARFRWATRVIGILALTAFITSVVVEMLLERFTGFTSPGTVIAFILDPPIAMTVLGVSAWLLFEVRGRRADARACVGSSADALTMDSCLRRQKLMDLAFSAIILGTMGVLLSMPALYLAQTVDSTQEVLASFRLIVEAVAAGAVLVVLLRPILSRRSACDHNSIDRA
ncbi:hypothetical protein ACPPVW_05020 [Leifsonia sp. McL0607]|uniref:hypothetical protein n=1 Tax=Leifsonia sp. McL0607 TaxID=3415672 RepID=UPI003CF56F4E